MPLPGDITTITVTATYPDGSGSPLFGYVTFTPSTDLTDSTGHVIVRAAPIQATLTRGSISIVLACTDNATLSPSGWYWIVTEVVGNSTGNLATRTYNVLLPHTLGSTVDLSTLAPVTPGPPVSTLYGVLAAGNTNTWLSNQVFSGALKIPTGAATGDVLTSDSSGNATWQPATGGIQPPAGDIGGTLTNPTVRSTTLTNPLPFAQGGTSAGSQQGAINALTGAQTAGRYLRSDGTNATLSAIVAGDVPTLNQNTTGTASNVTGTVAIGNGGTGQTSAAAAYNALSPMTTLGDIEFESGANTASRLAGNTTATKNFLTQTGTGSVSAAPAWGVITSADLPSQAWQFRVTDAAYGAKGDGKISNTGATNGTATVTIGEAVLTAGDVGKVVMVKNALNNNNTTGQTTSVGTITTVNSSTSFTATWNTTPTQTASSLQVLWGTDDTAAIQSAIAAANTYAASHGGLAEVFFPPPPGGNFYAVGGTLANTGAGLAAALGTVRLTGSSTAITVQTGTGAGGLGTGLVITKEQVLPGVPSSGIPALVDGTSVSNTLWRPATVYLSGGTNVTTVATSRLAGGVNTVAVSTVVSQAAGALPANTPIRLGPGQWIKVTTSAGTLPTAVWVLD